MWLCEWEWYMRILQWEMTHNDLLFKALNYAFIALLFGLFAFSYYVIYINYGFVWIHEDPTMEMTHPLSHPLWAYKS